MILQEPKQLALLTDTPTLFTAKERKEAERAQKREEKRLFYEQVELQLAYRNCLFDTFEKSKTRRLCKVRWFAVQETRRVFGLLRLYRKDGSVYASQGAYFIPGSKQGINPQEKEQKFIYAKLKEIERDLARPFERRSPFGPATVAEHEKKRLGFIASQTYLKVLQAAISTPTEDELNLALINRFVLAEFIPVRP